MSMHEKIPLLVVPKPNHWNKKFREFAKAINAFGRELRKFSAVVNKMH